MPESCENAEGESYFVGRSTEILLSLPFQYRWEFTRRRPYYQRFWRLARGDFEPRDEGDRLLHDCSKVLMHAIGVSSEPIDPAIPYSELSDGTGSQPWESGAATQPTVRGIIVAAFGLIPDDLRAEIAELLRTTQRPGNMEMADQYSLLERLSELQHPDLNRQPNAPFLTINVNAPKRAILDAVGEYVDQWKKDQGIDEVRRRDDKLEEYLRIWDLREGWDGQRYDLRQERTFRSICEELKLSPATAASRYKSAFRYIAGHEYSPEIWVKVMGSFKLVEAMPLDILPARSLKRPWKNRGDRPIPASLLDQRGFDAGGFLANASATRDEIVGVELSLDVVELIERGRTNHEILAELELKPTAIDFIEWQRQRTTLPG